MGDHSDQVCLLHYMQQPCIHNYTACSQRSTVTIGELLAIVHVYSMCGCLVAFSYMDEKAREYDWLASFPGQHQAFVVCSMESTASDESLGGVWERCYDEQYRAFQFTWIAVLQPNILNSLPNFCMSYSSYYCVASFPGTLGNCPNYQERLGTRLTTYCAESPNDICHSLTFALLQLFMA